MILWWICLSKDILVDLRLHASLSSLIIKNILHKLNVFISLLKNNIIQNTAHPQWNLNYINYLPSRLLNLNYITAIFYNIFNCKQKSWPGIQTHTILNFLVKLLMHIALSTSCPFPFVKRIFTYGTKNQLLDSISFLFFLHVAISDSVQWLPYWDLSPVPCIPRVLRLYESLFNLQKPAIENSIPYKTAYKIRQIF